MNATRALLLAVIGATALAAGIWAGSRSRSTPPAAAPTNAVVLPSPREVADFVLADQDGAPFTRENLKGRWSLLFAGFTHCPDVCPTTLGVMKAVGQRLPADAAALQMIFLSVDPERNTPETLKRYVGYFSPTLLGITGESVQLDRLTASLGLAYMKVPGTSATDYSVDHSAALALINPDAQVTAYFQPPHLAETLAADLARLIGTAPACAGLEVRDAWIREAPPGAGMTAGYAQLLNRGSATLRIDGATSGFFGDASLHRTTLVNGSYVMEPVPVLEIPAGASVLLAPNGLHLMLMQPSRPLRAGERVPVSFSCGQNRTGIDFTVRADIP